MRHKYNLGFISDADIFNHVRDTVEKYRTSINIEDFNSNIVDPIKLTFDSKVFDRDIREIIKGECLRQIDKTNGNHIGYFHQNIFRYAGHGWEVPANGVTGFDVQNQERHIYVEVKNKHNTMNSSASQKIYIKMQNQILADDKAVCMLVEVIAKRSQNKKWETCIDKKKFAHERIRRVSIDQFYEIVFGERDAFSKLCRILPTVLEDVIETREQSEIGDAVFESLATISPDVLRSLFLYAFKTYEGFEKF